jgi:hypothetical protein
MLMVAAGLTAFALVLVGAAASYVTLGGPNRAQTQPRVTQVGAAPRRTDNGVQQTFEEPPQQDATPAPAPTATLEQAPEPAAPAEATYALTPHDAATVALTVAARASVVSVPELVSYEGTVAYEVRTDLGLLYVDANSGAVLYNGMSVENRPYGRGRSHERDDDDHEYEGDDD